MYIRPSDPTVLNLSIVKTKDKLNIVESLAQLNIFSRVVVCVMWCSLPMKARNQPDVSPFAKNTVRNRRKTANIRKSRPFKPVLKTGRSEMKPPITSSRELGVSPGSKLEDGWGKESEEEIDVECWYSAGLFSEETVLWKKCLKWAHTLCVNYPKRAFVCVRQASEMTDTCIVAAKYYGKLHFVVLTF